ncbi:protein-glutamate O-methyltransferase-like protein [Dinothrombium tinctorium]|uniref:Sugar phosphate phosphatase n=1 Tax=Dinothrombium tinctorium TaxID=1965070 RepID=A0A443RD70_9ACAR|nr:protein-glutamate O-methyltransferase-like protein [Dinothrombium tinctorium]RWS13214.1 protein-glutamate O-methyltransferase-like protein [Dinothrombium tinctorium]
MSTQTPEPYRGNNQQCFAYITIKERLPTILVKAMDCFLRNAPRLFKHNPHLPNEQREAMESDCKAVIAKFSQLRYEMMTDKELKCISGECNDVLLWNRALLELQEKQNNVTWFSSPWLFAECLMYRKISEFFKSSIHFSSFDPFEEQKKEALISSIRTAHLLAEFLCRHKCEAEIDEKQEFLSFLQLSLWGNKCDLSLSSGEQRPQDDNFITDLLKYKSFILCDNSDRLWDFVHSLKSNSKRIIIDIILDNAGFELFTDLCFVEMLYVIDVLNIETSLVRFHVKKIPWFVSDALKKDFYWLLEYIINLTDLETLSKLGSKWKNYLSEGLWVILEEDFWTLPYDYSEMQRIAPKLYSTLQEANLLIFKGDLNYRKLTGDLQWDNFTHLKTALRGFLPSSFCALRTIKADVVVGLSDKLSLNDLPSNWKTSGEYALIQFVECN